MPFHICIRCDWNKSQLLFLFSYITKSCTGTPWRKGCFPLIILVRLHWVQSNFIICQNLSKFNLWLQSLQHKSLCLKSQPALKDTWMEVEGLASSTTNPWNGSWAVSNVTAEVASEARGVVPPNVRPIPLNATYFGSGGACLKLSK